jgi:hypothetical protein
VSRAATATRSTSKRAPARKVGRIGKAKRWLKRHPVTRGLALGSTATLYVEHRDAWNAAAAAAWAHVAPLVQVVTT